jgi:hypothetical protein
MKPKFTIRVWPPFRLEERSDGYWTFDTDDLERVRRAVGEDLLVGFLRCFVWVDRLQSIWHFHDFNIKNLPESSVAYARNSHSLASESVAVLHEAGDAVDDLNRAGIKGRLRDTARWEQLRGMAKRRKTDQRVKNFRDKVGFHVDRELMRAGLRRICAEAEGERITIMAGDDATVGRGAMGLGYIALLNGTGMEEEGYNEIIKTALDDAGPFRDLVQGTLSDLLTSMGIM